jgi:hypothetical protein|tara:strand:- start:95 stop:301 length:207 start_codon:yes stop_codon:yes gene_type:complete
MGEIFNLWLLFGGIGTLFIYLYFKHITFRKVEDEKTIRHIFGITPPTFIEGIIIIVVFLMIIKLSYKG